jgi:signal transduction protein with GAF and PtsI domain
MRYMQSAERKAKQLETIAHLSSTIVSNTYLHEILQLIVTMTAQMMNSKICSLMLLDDKSQELKITATQSLSEEYRKKPPLKLGQSVSGRALKLRRPVAVNDVTSEPGYVYPDIARREGLRSMLAVPMLIKDKPIGVINCYTSTEHSYSEEEVSILQTIANQAAVAIENTNLLKESNSAREALETRKTIERAKGMIMKERHLSEEDAFQFIQKQAMNLRRTMREVAEAVLLTEGLKDKQRGGLEQ